MTFGAVPNGLRPIVDATSLRITLITPNWGFEMPVYNNSQLFVSDQSGFRLHLFDQGGTTPVMRAYAIS
jgi:hypothetical protein